MGFSDSLMRVLMAQSSRTEPPDLGAIEYVFGGIRRPEAGKRTHAKHPPRDGGVSSAPDTWTSNESGSVRMALAGRRSATFVARKLSLASRWRRKG
ncbi:MAG: hypothetical protein AAF355_01185 [Myxococcota bacterium]